MGNGKVGKVIVTVGLANVKSDDFIYEKALVDTGADQTTIPLRVAKALEIYPIKGGWIKTGNGPVKVREDYVKIKLNNQFAYTKIWISDKIDKVLVGVLTLEELALKVNPKKRILEKEEQEWYMMIAR